MASSPTEQRLRALACSYDLALEAVLRDDVERVAALLQVCEQELQTLPESGNDDLAEQAARETARICHGRLLDALTQARSATLHELADVRRGMQVLKGYGYRTEATGTRVSSDV